MFSWVHYFQSHVFSISSLPLRVSLSEQAKQQTFCFSINVFYLFWEPHVFSSPQWPLQGHLGEPADIWRRLQKHVGGCQAVNPDPPDVSIHIVFKQTLSLRQKHRELRRNEGGFSECVPNFTFSSSSHFLFERVLGLQVEMSVLYRGALKTMLLILEN